MKLLWNIKRVVIVTTCISIPIIIAITFLAIKTASIKTNPFNSQEKNISLTVDKGESLYSLLDELHTQKQLNNLFFTKLYLKTHKVNTSIKSGYYELPTQTSLPEFLKMLNNGDVATTKVTFPEGFNIEQIAERLDKEKIVTKDDFIKEVKNYSLPSYVSKNNNKRYNLEGFLYPDTYNIPKNSTSKDIITMMLNKFEEIMLKAQKNTGVKVSEKDYEKIVTIASMIEKEAVVDQDRAKISSVIYNRLKINMPLQLDATVLYALGKHKSKVYLKDLKVESPYNTYFVKTLPIGPIASPGIKSIEATLKPVKSNYIYYLLGENKEHYFTDNYNDFLKAKKDFGY